MKTPSKTKEDLTEEDTEAETPDKEYQSTQNEITSDSKTNYTQHRVNQTLMICAHNVM